LRKFAATNQAEPKTTGPGENDTDDPKLNKSDDSGEPKTKFTPGGSNGAGGRNLYSRASIRNGNGTGSFKPEASENEEEKQSRTGDELPKTGFAPKQDQTR
jgi:hypothetical protein